jgi:predicted GNAT family N-acyltransferase
MLKVFRVSFEDDLFSKVRHVRQTVFVEEQGVSTKDENDKFEDTAQHYLITKNDESCGAARWRITVDGIKLERFAVLKAHRFSGIGKYLVEEVLKDVEKLNKPIYLHAQIQVVDFYLNLNFEKVGDLFEEAGIQHYKMKFKSSLSTH